MSYPPNTRQSDADAPWNQREYLPIVTSVQCPRCHRPIEVDRLNGKPSNHTGYCVGLNTCLQDSKPEEE